MNTDPSKGYLIIDATHGGVKLASEFKKQNPLNKVYIYDIYNTLKPNQIKDLKNLNIIIANLDEIEDVDYLNVIYPIHLPLTENEIIENINNPNTNFNFLTHHKAVKLLINDLDSLKIEITGVKGKTSSAFILKEILKNYNTLLLSSLGLIYNDEIIQKDISITPANIVNALDICKNKDFEIAIFENSLGSSAIGDVALLTNIAENYPIANNLRDASVAKGQIFDNDLIAIKLETLNKYYKNQSLDKINTFSINNESANLYCLDIDYNLKNTKLKIKYNNLKTINSNFVNGELEVFTFAPGKYHVENILGAICVALACEIPKNSIINGLKDFKGLPGRTNIRKIKGKTIIEEINPGINTKAIEYSINMIEKPEEYSIILGGDYGITCEEIDEEKVANLLNNINNLDLTLTGEVGRNILSKTNNNFRFIEDYNTAIEHSIAEDKNILFIYRSDYRKLNRR